MAKSGASETGGTHWELGKARELMISAQQADDDEALTVALMQLADALVNAASSGSADALVPLLLQLREARGEAHQASADRRTDAIVSEHNQSLLIDQAEVVQAEQGKQAARLGLAEVSILALLLSRAESSAGRKALTQQIAELGRRVARLEEPHSGDDAWHVGDADRRQTSIPDRRRKAG